MPVPAMPPRIDGYHPQRPEREECEHDEVTWYISDNGGDKHSLLIDISGECDTCGVEVHESQEVEIDGGWPEDEEVCSECGCSDDYCDCWQCNFCGGTDADDDQCCDCACTECNEMWHMQQCEDCGVKYGCASCICETDWKDAAVVCESCGSERGLSDEDKNQLAKAKALEAMASKIREAL